MADSGAPEAIVFRYRKPEFKGGKGFQRLGRTALTMAAVQIVREGGENNLHSHRHMDGVWYVLRGRARFYTTDNEVVAEVGPDEGIIVPRHYPYWFESVGEEDLEILQVESTDKPDPAAGEGFEDDRVNYEPLKKSYTDSVAMEPQGG